jgi:chromate transporter
VADTIPSDAEAATAPERLAPIVVYFLKLGTLGFGGPVALAGYMQRDLVEKRGWVSTEDYKLAFALAQVMPGPLAAQLAIALGYFRNGVVGATLVGIAFVLPSFLMVVGLAALYVAFGGLWWMQALFYGIGAVVIAVIAIATYKLARKINGRDPLLWGIFGALAVLTVWAEAEPAEFFLLAGLLVLMAKAPPRWLKARLPFAGLVPLPLALPALASAPGPRRDTLVELLLFFTKAGAFVFGSGLAIVPFLNQGVVHGHGWLSEQEFLDAVAVAMITPGPVVITVAFIGYLVAGLAGATVAAVVLAQRAIVDVPTALIALVGLGVLWRFKVPEPLLVVAAGGIGLALWPVVG